MARARRARRALLVALLALAGAARGEAPGGGAQLRVSSRSANHQWWPSGSTHS